jgi:hypothetical protein
MYFGIPDRQPDRRTDGDINPVWASLIRFLQVNVCVGYQTDKFPLPVTPLTVPVLVFVIVM